MMLVMNSLNYDAMAVGNHEYNFGLKVLEKARGEANFPWLSGNTYDKGTGRTHYKPYIVKEVAGVKIGILGLTTPGVPYWDNPPNYAGLEFRDPVPEARKWVPTLRDAGESRRCRRSRCTWAWAKICAPANESRPDSARERSDHDRERSARGRRHLHGPHASRRAVALHQRRFAHAGESLGTPSRAGRSVFAKGTERLARVCEIGADDPGRRSCRTRSGSRQTGRALRSTDAGMA